MSWLELHQSLFTHRKTMQAADILDLPEVYVVAHLMALWTWSLDNAPDGVLPDSRRIIGKAAQWSGDPAMFTNALVNAGFLDIDEAGQTVIHDWQSYAGRLIEKREANTERMRRTRAANTLPPNNVAEVTQKENVQSTCDARAGATVQYTTQHNRTEQNTTELNTDKGPEAEMQTARKNDPSVLSLGLNESCPEKLTPISEAKKPIAKKQGYDADMLALWEAYPALGRTRGSLKDLQMVWSKLTAEQKVDAVTGLHAALQSSQFREYPKAPHRWIQGRCWEVFLGDLTPLPSLVPALPNGSGSPHGAGSAMGADSAERLARFQTLRKQMTTGEAQ